MIKGVIFDMDGVLVDNRDIHIEAFEIFCRRYGCILDREKLMGMFGHGNEEIMPLLMPEEVVHVKGIEELGREKEEIYREIFRDRIEPTRGLVAFLAELRRRGYLTAVGSSGNKANVDFVLEKCGIAGCFDAVVNGQMVTRCKPDPEIYLLAASLLGVSPSQCLVIEDAPAGISAARSAGMHVAVLATTFERSFFDGTPKDIIADDFTGITVDAVAAL